jgi:probable rRNA maturation factor
VKLRKGKRIPREDGKRIEEWVGMATTGTPGVSLARMLAPPGWHEPAQTPEFDEVVVVLKGELTQVVNGKAERIREGEVGLVPKGSRVVYRNDGSSACDYFSICAPAFQPALAHVEVPAPKVDANVVQVAIAHPKGQTLEKLLAEMGEGFLGKLGLSGRELSISLVGDRAIRRLNRTWRKKDKPTDVLSFPADEGPRGAPGPKPLGDVVISLDTASRVAKQDARPLEAELARYLAHGILHLLGYDHERSAAEARKMFALEEKLLGGEGLIPAEVAFPRPRRRKRGELDS